MIHFREKIRKYKQYITFSMHHFILPFFSTIYRVDVPIVATDVPFLACQGANCGHSKLK